jgi:predicted peroxiredoxin
MAQNEEVIMCFGTHAGDNAEKAAMPFVMACGALAMDVKAVVVLQGPGVYIAQKGYVDNMLPPGGFPPLKKLLADFLELGGDLRVCGPCIAERNIKESDFVEGAKITAAGELVLQSMEAKAVFVY